jgi:hypothetical protein
MCLLLKRYVRGLQQICFATVLYQGTTSVVPIKSPSPELSSRAKPYRPHHGRDGAVEGPAFLFLPVKSSA